MKKRSSRNGAKFLGKIKTEHSIVQGIIPMLEELVKFPEVKSIIPGRIMRRGTSPKAFINLTIKTKTGWKALGKSGGSTQELFIVSDQPEKLQDLLKSADFLKK